MSKYLLYRNARARDLLDAFLVSAVTSVLLIRFYLEITNYPQLGSGGLHIAHMLYGGLFMMISIVITLLFLGAKAREVSAIIGGVGFGIFIDELGKFITKDNDYFYEPTVGIIYAVFVILYLAFNFLTRSQRLSSHAYQLNALSELEEAVAYDMDRHERARIYALLEASDQNSPITKHLRKFVDTLDVSATHKPTIFYKLSKHIDKIYKNFWQRRHSNILIGILFVLEVIVLIGAVIYTLYANIDDIRALFDGTPTYGEELLLGQIASAAVAGGFVIYGLTKLKSSRLSAFEQFRRATLINIYLTQFFVFVRLQFEALPGLFLNIILLILITFVIRQETRLGKRKYVKSI